MYHRLLNNLGRMAAVTCLGLALLAGGCASFERPYPDKFYYAIALEASPGPSTGAIGPSGAAKVPSRQIAPILRVRSLRISKPFDATSFVYKVGESRFTTDYYHGFIAEPGRLLSGELLKWLTASGEFGSVVEESSTADYRLTLESCVSEMYGDYTDKRSPRAVMELRVFVIDDVPSSSKVIFQKTYRETQPLSDNTPEKLVRGWEDAYRRILTRFLSDLRASPDVADAGSRRP